MSSGMPNKAILNRVDRLMISTIGFILIVFSSQAIWVTFSPIATYVAEDLGVEVELVGFLAVTYPVFFLLLTIPSGILLDKDFKRWFLFGVVTTFISAFGRLVSINYLWLFSCQLAGAIGQPFLLNAFVPYASQTYSEEKRPRMISILSLSMYLGTVYALATGTKLYAMGGIRLVILPISVISIAGLLLTLFGAGRMEFTRGVERKVVDRMGEVIRRRDLWIIGALLGLGVATFDNLATWLQPALRDVGLEGVAGDVVALSIILGLIGVALIPDKIAGRGIRTIYLRTIIPLIAVFFAVLVFAINKILLFVFLPISGFLMLPAYAIIMDWIGKYCGRDIHGSATGFVGLTSRAISVALTIIAVYFIGNSRVYFTFLTAPLVLALILSWILPKDEQMGMS